MTETYRIPLMHHAGKYLAAELSAEGECLVIEHDKFDIMTYMLPVYGTEVRRYSVPKEAAEKTLTAVYGKDGALEHVDVLCGGFKRLIYIHFPDNEAAKETIWRFCSYQGEELCRSIGNYSGRAARLFEEHFYDGEAVDFAVRIASPEEVGEVALKYGDGATDNSGNYGDEWRIPCDTDTWGTMILCGAPDFRGDMYGFGVFIMSSAIKSNALPKLDKTADFKYIRSKYD